MFQETPPVRAEKPLGLYFGDVSGVAITVHYKAVAERILTYRKLKRQVKRLEDPVLIKM